MLYRIMADEKPSLHIDTDWKKQAQEEKRRLAEQAEKAKAAPVATPTPALSPASPAAAAPAARAGRAAGRREMKADFSSLVQSLMTQVLYYLGEIGTSSGMGGVDLDMARHNVDLLGMLEEKSKNNLTPEEATLLDTALYETRTRFSSTAMQFLGP